MKIINIILNTIIKILTILLSITYGIFIFVYCNEKIIPSLFGWGLCVLIISTSFVDLIRPKEANIKYNLLNLILIFFMLLNIFIPYINPLILNNLANSIDINLFFSYYIFEQNFILITIFMIILFIINFKFKTK